MITQESVPCSRYNALARWLHWMMAIFVIAGYVAVFSYSEFPRGSEARTLIMQAHCLFGVMILLLVIPRALNRGMRRAPPISPAVPAALKKAGSLVALMFYLFFFIQPLMGLLSIWIDGGSISFPFVDLQIPSLFLVNKKLAGQIMDMHHFLGLFFIAVIGLHILAVLYHQFFRRDDTLNRML